MNRIFSRICFFSLLLIFSNSLKARYGDTLYTFKVPSFAYSITSVNQSLIFHSNSSWLQTDFYGTPIRSVPAPSLFSEICSGERFIFTTIGNQLVKFDTATFAEVLPRRLIQSPLSPDIIAYNAGKIWFSKFFVDSLGVVDTSGGIARLLNLNRAVWALEFDTQNPNKADLWVASGQHIARIDTTTLSIIDDLNYFSILRSRFSNTAEIAGLAITSSHPQYPQKTILFATVIYTANFTDTVGVIAIDVTRRNNNVAIQSVITPTPNQFISANVGFIPSIRVINRGISPRQQVSVRLSIFDSTSHSIYNSEKVLNSLMVDELIQVYFDTLTAGLPRGTYTARAIVPAPDFDTLRFSFTSSPQTSSREYQRVGFLGANQVRTKFLSNGLFGSKSFIAPSLPTWSWPVPENEYIFDLNLIIGCERIFRDTVYYNFNNPSSTQGQRLRDGFIITLNPSTIISQITLPNPFQNNQSWIAAVVVDSAKYVTTHFGPRVSPYRVINGQFEGLEPSFKGVNTNSDHPPTKSIPSSYPSSWGGVWRGGIGPNGQSVANEEVYFVVDDATDKRLAIPHYNYDPTPEDQVNFGVGFEIIVRALQFTDPRMRDAVVLIYDVKNTSSENRDKCVIGNVVGTAVGRVFQANYSFFDTTQNLTYTYNPNGEVDALWNLNYPVGGVGLKLLETPDNKGLTSFKLDLPSRPFMNNSEDLWRFTRPNLFDTLPQPGDYDYTQGTGYFTLNAGETKRYALSIFFAANEFDLAVKPARIQAFYDSLTGRSSAPITISKQKPTTFALHQNYPNPFNPTTTITYQIATISDVRLDLFDILGRRVATLINVKQQAGRYVYNFNASAYNLSTGIYFYRLQAGNFIETRKMMLLK